MKVLKKAIAGFFGIQIVLLSLMEFMSALHGHPLLQLFSLAVLCYGAVYFYKAYSRATARTDAQVVSNAPNPAAHAAAAQATAPAPSQAPAPAPAKAIVSSPVYYKSPVVRLKNRP